MRQEKNKVVVKKEVDKVDVKQEGECEFQLCPEIKIEGSIHGNSIRIKEEPLDEIVQESDGINNHNYFEFESDPKLLNLFKEEDVEDSLCPAPGLESTSLDTLNPNSGFENSTQPCSSHFSSVTSLDGIIKNKVLPINSDENEESSEDENEDSSEDEINGASTNEFLLNGKWKYEIEIVRTGTGEIRENFKCGTCQTVVKHKRNMIAHIRQLHELSSRHHCGVCSRSFTNEETLQNHFCEYVIEVRPKEYRRTKVVAPGKFIYGDKWPFHIDGDFFVCGTCSEKRKLKPQMTSHITRKHADLNRLICGHCSKSFSNIKALKGHQVIHAKAEQREIQRAEAAEKRVKFKVKYKKKDPIFNSIMFSLLRNKSNSDT